MASSSEALKSAVHQHSLTSVQGMQQRLFSTWFNSFIYNQIWEDPELDMQALDLDADSEILTIASGGCNVLNYLTASPARIVALDLNPYHLSLTRLKIAAMEHLPNHRMFYDFFGYADSPQNPERFEAYIEPRIDAELAAFWNGRTLLRGKRIKLFSDGLYRHTRFGYFMRFLHWIGRKARHEPYRLLNAKSLDEQRKIFDEHIRPFFDNRLVTLLGKLPMSVFSLGIPPQQYKAMKNQGNLFQQYCERVERLACDFPVQDNYFAWQAFSHSYDHKNRRAIPAYLKEENYALIKQQLYKLDTQAGTLIDYLRAQPDNTLNRFVFLDAQDWMSDKVLTDLWQEVRRVGQPGSRIVFRTAADSSPLETALPHELREQFDYDPEASRTLFRQDRSAIYGGFHLYRLTEQ